MRFVVALLALLLAPSLAHADELTSTDGPVGSSAAAPALLAPPPADPLVPAAITSLVAGGAIGITGGIVWQTAHGRRACGASSGCIELSATGPQRATGTAMLGAGLGLGLSGGIGMAVSLGRPLRPGETRHAPAVATVGYGFMSLSLASLGAGFAYGAGSRARPDYGRAAPFWVAGAVSGVVAIPMMAEGSYIQTPTQRHRDAVRRVEESDEAAAEKRWLAAGRPTRMNSRGMVIAGVTLIGVGVTSVGVTGVVLASCHESGWFACMGQGVGFAAALGGSVILTAIGAPLIAVGSQRRSDGLHTSPEAQPSVELRAGPGSLVGSGSF